MQNVHMNARKHAWNDGVAANARGALQTQEALHVSFVRRNQTTFRTSNARTSLYPLPETPNGSKRDASSAFRKSISRGFCNVFVRTTTLKITFLVHIS